MNPSARPLSPRRPWLIAYVLFVVLFAALAAARLWWAGPDVAWLSNFWFLGDVDKFVNGDLGQVTWVTFGDQWALNGYRWFEYANAVLFHGDTRIETIAYYTIAAAIALVIGFRILNRLQPTDRWWLRLIVFVVPLVTLSMTGAGSRGMELGTYAGIFLLVAEFLLIDSRLPNRAYFIVVSITVPLIIFTFTGGYASGPAVALVLVWALQFWRPTVQPRDRIRLTVMMGTVAAWTVVYFISVRILAPYSGASQFGGFLSAVGADPTVPAKFLFWGPAATLFSSQTLEMLGTSAAAVSIVVSIVVILLTLAAAGLAFRNARREMGVPLLLALYPWGISIVLLATRSSDLQGLLSTWYGLHFKIGLIGVVWLLVIGLRGVRVQRAPLVVAAKSLVALVVCAVLVANVLQFQRQPYERTFYLNAARQELFPSELKQNASGLTSLEVSLKASMAAVAILKRDKLSVYHNPASTLANLPGGSADYVYLGSYFPDSWVGRKFSVVVVNPACTTLTVDLTNPIALPKPIDFTAKTTFGTTETGEVSGTTQSVVFHPHGTLPRVNFTFSGTFRPVDLGQGADKRNLASTVRLTCSP